jgi:carboxyl-terminal processing protease
MTLSHRPFALATICAASLTAFLFCAPAQAQLECSTIPQLAKEYLRNHVSYKKLTGDLESRTIDTYLRRVDASHSAFLASELEHERSQLGGIFERMQEEDCKALTCLHDSLVKRNAALESFVRTMLDQEGFSLDESVELQLDPDDRGYPASASEREKLLRSLVHFQLSNYLSSGEPLDEAKKRLVERYERRTKRMRELETVDLYSSFLDSFALSLDPHSNYLSAEVLEDFRISMSLSLEGIGVALAERDGYSVVERIIPGGAADRLGEVLRPKDKIIAVAEAGGEPVSIIDMPLRDAVSLIRGKKGTTVDLTVLRTGEKTERFPLSIVRDTIDLAEQAAKLRFEERELKGKKYKLALVELPSFYGDQDPTRRQCTDDLEKILAQVKEAGADGLLLDLSRNGGGLLEHAVKISGFFLRKGEVVGVENSRGQLQVLSDRDERILYTGPMVVHTSRISASASEILAGALKDYKRAIITGDDHTFGKGTVQTVTPLPAGHGALKVTTALFFRPGGKSTQNDGVLADISIPSILTAQDFGEKTQRFALESEKVSPFLSSYANAIGPSDRWSRVSAPVITELSKLSKTRVETNEDFQKIREDIVEARENDGVVKLSDILKEQEEAKANGDPETSEETPEEADEELTPQTEEALNVLADLIALTRSNNTTRSARGDI